MHGLWTIQGPFRATMPKSKQWRAEFQPQGRTGYDAGTAWAPTEQQAREKAARRAKLKNTTRTTR